MTVIQTASRDKASASSSAGSEEKASSGGLSTGAIIGISVVAGVAALAGGLFLVFRLTSKRFSGFDDDGDDAIRWSVPLVLVDSHQEHANPSRV